MAQATDRDLAQDCADRDTLEALIDRYSLANLIEGLVQICHYKADHLRTTWQDAAAAKDWSTDARTLDRIVSTLRNAG